MYAAARWRTFRWYYGQRHYSGSYWSATQRDQVIYESRLELAALLFADYDRSVRHIVAQPFQVQAQVGGQSRKHVPDYLWDTADGLVVVDVVRAERRTKPVNRMGLRLDTSSRGIAGVIPHRLRAATGGLSQCAFLAGYRREWLINPGVLEQLRCRAAELGGM